MSRTLGTPTASAAPARPTAPTAPTPPEVHRTIAGLRTALQRERGRRVALVPTMGALHAGHLALVERARALADVVVVSIFVNPLQFGAGEDLDRYPRTLDADLTALVGRADLVFAPDAAEMYPNPPAQVRVAAGPIGQHYEGASRPGHFDGMLTVVTKLLHIVQPDIAVFGQKDAQQARLVRQLVADLNLPVAVEVVPTVREGDGLALSSRNRYLGDADRADALALSECLRAASDAAASGAGAALAAAHARMDASPAVKLDYLVLVEPASFAPVDDDYRGPALLLIAARVGSTRLIDNAELVIGKE